MTETGFSFSAPRLGVLLASVRRFPLPALASLLFALVQIAGIHDLYDLDDWPQFSYGCFAAFLALLSVALVGEGKKWPFMRTGLVSCLVILLLAGWIMVTGSKLGLPHVLLGFAMLGLCVVAPALSGANNDALWQFNQRSFTGLGLAGIAVVVFQIGIGIILYACDQLFGLSRGDKPFLDATTLVMGVFWPLYTLTFVPKLPMEAETGPRLPGALAFILSYVALPVLLVYGAVIAVYGVAVLGLGQPPKASVSWMVMGFAAAGILIHFLLYPLRESGNLLVRLYHRFFFALLLPYLGLLFWAVVIRIREYGWTEMRYLAVAGGIWALGLALLALARQRELRLVTAPAVLTMFLLLSSFGPWGAEGVGFVSQEKRLVVALSSLNLLENGVVRAKAEITSASWETRQNLSSLLDYFHDRRDRRRAAVLQPVLTEDYGWPGDMMRNWGMTYVGHWDTRDSGQNFYYSASLFNTNDMSLSVGGFDQLFGFRAHASETPVATRMPSFTSQLKDNQLVLAYGDESTRLALLDLLPQPPEKQSYISGDVIVRDLSIGRAKLRLMIENLQGDRRSGAWVVTNVSGYILFTPPR